MSEQTVLCECGHRRATHLHRRDKCMSPGPLGRGCHCTQFTQGSVTTPPTRKART
ncbi:hypothetical protein [Nocardia farcinica]|uniref:hypothetical protein n=1 Tax=Nocardia farcinica TaxID=37329 RepID=UPI00245692EE|nr:hypothetical protein [Nocardia farcinica]